MSLICWYLNLKHRYDSAPSCLQRASRRQTGTLQPSDTKDEESDALRSTPGRTEQNHTARKHISTIIIAAEAAAGPAEAPPADLSHGGAAVTSACCGSSSVFHQNCDLTNILTSKPTKVLTQKMMCSLPVADHQ